MVNSYWEKRNGEIAGKVFKKDDKTVKALNSIYNEVIPLLLQDLEAFYQRYANDSGLTLAEAKKKVSATAVKTIGDRIKRLVSKKDITPQEEQELRRLQYKVMTNRLELLIAEMELKLIENIAEQEKTMLEHLKEVGLQAYGETAQAISTFAKLPEAELLFIVNMEWSGDSFSSRLWKNKDVLVYNLKRVITTGLIRGENPRVMAREFRKSVESSKHASERLLRTETTHVLNQASMKAYDDNGVKEYEHLSKLDSRTSEICRKRDGKRFKVKDAKAGVNMPPLHPYCRSTVVPVVPD